MKIIEAPKSKAIIVGLILLGAFLMLLLILILLLFFVNGCEIYENVQSFKNISFSDER